MAIIAYKLTVGGKTYDLNFAKGTPNYSILVNAVPGDFNFDGVLNNADICKRCWALQDINTFKSANNLSDSNLLAIGDLNGDHAVDGADIPVMLNRLVSATLPPAFRSRRLPAAFGRHAIPCPLVNSSSRHSPSAVGLAEAKH